MHLYYGRDAVFQMCINVRKWKCIVSQLNSQVLHFYRCAASAAHFLFRRKNMDLKNINFSEMSDKDWDDLEKKAKKEREEMKKNDLVEALDMYNEMVQNVYKAFQYKTAMEMLQFKFIDVYDISRLTGISLKEIKCIEIFLENTRQ